MDNSSFISYRRSISGYSARAVFQELRSNGIDAFLDIESIDSGHFESVILQQIAARPYFILILAPGCLERCDEPDDWLRREIETAMDLERVIIPLLTSGFVFDAPYAHPYLTGKLETLSTFNSVNVPLDYFEEAMTRLLTRFLKPVDLPQTPVLDQQTAQEKITQAEAEPRVTHQQLLAQQAFEHALARPSEDFEGQIADLTTAIQHDSTFTIAYYHRSLARRARGDQTGATEDYRRYAYSKGIGLKPKQAAQHNNRGHRLYQQGELEQAITEFSTAIGLNPNFTTAYVNRGTAYLDQGDVGSALSDYQKAIELDATYWFAFYKRGTIFKERNNIEQACADFQQALALKPNQVEAVQTMQIFVNDNCL